MAPAGVALLPLIPKVFIMNKQRAISVVSRIASLDFNGDNCTEASAAAAIRIASIPGYCTVDDAVEAIKTLGESAATTAYLEQWESDYTNEYETEA